MGRTTLIAVLGAAVVGSTGGGLAALHLKSTRARPAQVAVVPPPSAGSSAPAPAAVSDAGIPGPTAVEVTAADAALAVATPDPHASLTTQLIAVLTRFAAWSRDHAGAPCPELATLGLAARDPWGHHLTMTCTDQPADQIIGVLSPGPDGVIGTDDDVPSWTLGPRVTSLVRGPRWKPSPSATPPVAKRPTSRRPSAAPPIAPGSRPIPPTTPVPAPDPHHTSPPTGSAVPPPPPPDPTGDDIPARRSSR